MYWYWFAMVAMGVTGYLIYYFWTKSRKQKRSVTAIRKKDTITVTENIFEDPFNLARNALYRSDKQKFYNEIQRVLWRTVAEKCQATPSALNKQNIVMQLRDCKIPEDTISELQYILNECEWAVYTPSLDEKDMSKILASAQRIKKDISAS
jgi:hypothetical protein